MKAFVIPRPGVNTVEPATIPAPRIDADEHLVRMYAVGVGIHDSYFLPANAQYPYVIGIEGAGVVEDVGGSVTKYRPGDRIAFVSSMQPKGGTWAEFAAVSDKSLIVRIPAGLDFLTAAAVPVAGNTVLRAYSALANLPAGGSLFIAGGSGALGTLAIQLARQRGWRVAASASQANHEYMLSLGAEVVVDYHDQDWPDAIRCWLPGGVDAALAVQPGTVASAMPIVKAGGQVIAVSGDKATAERGVRVEMIPYQAAVHDQLVQLMSDVERGVIHVEIERAYEFEDARAALAKVQSRRARGKSVLRVA